MGGKKKGKANKLARMSEEEKMRYLQHRAAIEEEARRRKEQLISTFMKNKLKREEGFSRLNMAKINQEWRQTLRRLKCVELKQDLEDLFKWFDYSAAKKNETVEILLEDLEEAESQYFRISTSRMETFDKLIKLHKQRIDYFYEQYKKERDEMYQKATEELREMTNSYIADEEQLQATLYRMEETCQETIAALTSRHESKMDELRNNMLTELENLKNSRELQIEKIWAKLENIIKQYWEQTEDRRRQYVIMKEADHDNCRQIFENNQQINAAVDVINNLKEQLAKVQALNEERSLERSAKKENSRRLLYLLKKKANEELEIDRRNLNFMNAVASKTTEVSRSFDETLFPELKRILEKGEKILQLQSLCRKLETENEKICSEEFDKRELTEEEEEEIEKQAQDYSEPLAAKAYNDLIKLDKFWKRYNRVLLEKEALALHHQSLENEQKRLISELKSYLSEVVVKQPESKVSYANGVRVPRRRPSTSAPVTRKTYSAITCIEATQSPSIREILSAQKRRS